LQREYSRTKYFSIRVESSSKPPGSYELRRRERKSCIEIRPGDPLSFEACRGINYKLSKVLRKSNHAARTGITVSPEVILATSIVIFSPAGVPCFVRLQGAAIGRPVHVAEAREEEEEEEDQEKRAGESLLCPWDIT